MSLAMSERQTFAPDAAEIERLADAAIARCPSISAAISTASCSGSTISPTTRCSTSSASRIRSS
jgi:hypothetical protein